MIKSNDIEERLSKLEASISKKQYEYCLCFDENLGGVLRLDKKSGIIELYDDDIPMGKGNAPYAIVFPEMLIYYLTHGDSIDSLNPFDRWYLEQVFKTTDDIILLKRIKKLQKQWDEEEAERRASYPTSKPYQGPAPVNENIDKKQIREKPVRKYFIEPDPHSDLVFGARGWELEKPNESEKEKWERMRRNASRDWHEDFEGSIF